MVASTYASNTQNTTFYFVLDNDTAVAMIPVLQQNCSSVLNSGVSNMPVFHSPNDPSSPKVEEAIQYHRVSSVMLMLEGYNNTGHGAGAFDADHKGVDVKVR